MIFWPKKISALKVNPCASSNCHRYAICEPGQGSNYTCKCLAPDYVDLEPGNPGHNCVPWNLICTVPGKTQCSVNATCRPLQTDPFFECICKPGFYDADPREKGRNCQVAGPCFNCSKALGEVCLENEGCTCPEGSGRKATTDVCTG